MVPGDQLRIEVTVLNWRRTAVKLIGKATVDGVLACEATIMCMLVPRGEQEGGGRGSGGGAGEVSIHPTAIVAEGAVVPASCTVGPFCTIGANVVLGEECELVSHVVLDGHTTFGARNKIFSFACLGIAPQDLKYAGEPTRVEFGDDNTIREYVTISRGTAGGGG